MTTIGLKGMIATPSSSSQPFVISVYARARVYLDPNVKVSSSVVSTAENYKQEQQPATTFRNNINNSPVGERWKCGQKELPLSLPGAGHRRKFSSDEAFVLKIDSPHYLFMIKVCERAKQKALYAKKHLIREYEK